MPTETLPFVPMRPDVITGETTVGRVVVSVKIENLGDVFDLRAGRRTADEVRSVEVDDALVDTGCSTIGLPSRMIHELGLIPSYRKPIRAVTGPTETTVYTAVALTIQGRTVVSDVFEISDDLPVLIGQIPLEQTDFVIDPRTQSLIGNPAHGGEWVLECY